MLRVTAFGKKAGRAAQGLRWLARALLVTSFWASWWPVAASAEPRAVARWAANPAWVQELTPDLGTPVDRDAMRNGTYTLLHDTRIRLQGKTVERYFRHVEMAVSQAGVATLGEVEIEYSPEYQQLVLHRAELVRDGHVIDERKLATLRMIEQEPDSASRVYSGSVSALLVLSDVRPGDVVDVAYSLDGSNPILDGRFANHVRLGARAQARRIHVEVTSAADRPTLHWSVSGTAPAPTDVLVDGKRVLTWDLKEVRPHPAEDRIPAEFAVPADLALSEFADWADVATWASKLYPPAPSPTLTAKAEELRRAAPTLEGAVLGAIHFVQDDVRYLSISMGPHSVKPHVPTAIYAQRFGDCKDKSYLLVELLRALGVEAHAALAESDLKQHVRQALPSPFAFDHAIAAIELGGKRYFVDATWAYQGGSLDRLVPPDLGAALIVSPSTTDLVDVPLPPLLAPPLSEVSDFVVADTGTAKLRVTTTYAGEEADGMRARLASKSEADLSHEYLNFYEKAFPGVSIEKALLIRDARAADIVTVEESYSIPEFWRTDGQRSLIPNLLWDYLEAPESQRREAPLYLSHPVWLRQEQRITLPFAPEIDPNQQTLDDTAAKVTREIKANGREVTAVHEYRSYAGVVPVSGLTHHLQFLSDSRKQVGLDLTKQDANVDSVSPDVRSARHSHTSQEPDLLLWVATPACVGIAGVLIWGASQRRARVRAARKRQFGPSSGSKPSYDLPQHAQAVASLDAALGAFTHSACACGTPLAREAVAFSQVSYQGRTLHAARALCAQCHTLKRAYFQLPVAS